MAGTSFDLKGKARTETFSEKWRNSKVMYTEEYEFEYYS